MNSKKALCRAVLIASILAASPLSSAQAAPWRSASDLPSVEKLGLFAWLPEALSNLWAVVWGKTGASADPNGNGGATSIAPLVVSEPGNGPDHGMSIDPNGGGQ